MQTSSWTHTSDNWLPGNYTCQARQWVRGASAGEKIYSEATAPLSFSISVPKPTLTFHVDEDQRPRFSGTGHHWDNQPATQVEVLGGTSTVPKAPVISGQWSTEASQAWAPGNHSVKARQLFQASGSPELASAWTDPIFVAIRPRLPTIDTIDENGLFPIFSGTCWPGAVVKFEFSDGGLPGSATSDNAGKWTFTRPQLSLPGEHTVTATQTFGGQTSNPASKLFRVAVIKPVITPLTAPVGHQDSVIEGHGGVPGAMLKIYGYHTESLLGEAPVTGDKWAVTIDELAFGPSDVYARQTFNQTHSEHSQPARLEVVLLAPVVQTPLPDDKVARKFTIQGRGARPKGSDAAFVHVWLDDAPDPWTVRVVWNTGHWEYDAVLPVGAHTLTFQQYFRDHKSVREALVLAVVPAKPFIESPASGEAIEAHMAVFGFGYPGDTVSLAFADATEVPLGTAEVQEDGTWSLRLPIDRPAGQAALFAQQSYGEHLSGWTEARALELRTDPPLFTAPRSGQWVLPQPVFAGTAEVGSAVVLLAWFNPEIKLGESSFTGKAWEATPSQALSPYEHWVRAQTSVGAQTSAMADSPRFEVITVAEKTAHPGA
ncbi:Ig-like domain-containing protein [Pseudomonas sp. S2_A02]